MSDTEEKPTTTTTKSTKPTLLPHIDEEEKRTQDILNGIIDTPTSAKLIRNKKQEVEREAATMTDDEIEAITSSTTTKKAPVTPQPSEFKYKLNDKERAAFLKTLTKDELNALPSEYKTNVDILVNTILQPPSRPLSLFFTISGEIREAMKAKGEKFSVSVIAERTKERMEKMSSNEKAKYDKLLTQRQTEYTNEQAEHKINLSTQDKAVEYYSKKLGIDVIHPQVAEKKRKEAINDQGLGWHVHFAQTVVKKMILTTPNATAPAAETIRLIGTATEAFVVWLGQQLAIRTVRHGKKTITPQFLKAFALEQPHSAFLSRLEPIQKLSSEPKAKSTSTTTKSSSKKSTDDESKGQTKLKLTTGGNTKLHFDMDDEDDVPTTTTTKGTKKSTTTKKSSSKKSTDKTVEQLLSDDEDATTTTTTTTTTPSKKSKSKKTDTKGDEANAAVMKQFLTKKSTAAETAAAKAQDDAEYAMAESTAAKKATTKSSSTKNKKDALGDQYYIPTDVDGADTERLRKDKSKWSNVTEIQTVGSKAMEYWKDDQLLDGSELNQFLTWKSQVQKLQSKSQTWLNAHPSTKASKSKNTTTTTTTTTTTGYEDDDDEEAASKAKKRKTPSKGDNKKNTKMGDDNDDEGEVDIEIKTKKPTQRPSKKADTEEVSLVDNKKKGKK